MLGLVMWNSESFQSYTFWVSVLQFKQKMSVLDNFGKPAMTPADSTNPWWLLLEEAVKSAGGKLGKPEIFPASTDARYFRQIGLPAFGFSPMANTPILLHDHNEFLHKDEYLKGIGVYESIIRVLATHKDGAKDDESRAELWGKLDFASSCRDSYCQLEHWNHESRALKCSCLYFCSCGEMVELQTPSLYIFNKRSYALNIWRDICSSSAQFIVQPIATWCLSPDCCIKPTLAVSVFSTTRHVTTCFANRYPVPLLPFVGWHNSRWCTNLPNVCSWCLAHKFRNY